jgi:hypothetical protein
LGKGLKNLKMPIVVAKMKIFKKEFLPNIPPKKISPETVERTLKS